MENSSVLVRAAVICAATMLSAAALQAAPARADVIFDFSGICDLQGCSGTATGVLALADSYVFGASGAVLEPSTWAMMLVGFGGLGYAGYRKARQAAVASV